MKRLFTFLLTIVLLAGLTAPFQAHASTGGKLIALTFDDGPGPYTNRLLDGLKTRGVQATFFMLGQRAAAYPGVVERAYREGHQIANHSYSHVNLTGQTNSGVKSQIRDTNSQLDKACGAGTSYLIRAPYGSAN